MDLMLHYLYNYKLPIQNVLYLIFYFICLSFLLFYLNVLLHTVIPLLCIVCGEGWWSVPSIDILVW